MELRRAHLALLRAVDDLQVDGERYPGTDDCGARLLTIYREMGGPYSFSGSRPWHGTAPMARELDAAGLLKVHAGAAKFVAPGAPTPTTERFYLQITDAGRQALRGDEE